MISQLEDEANTCYVSSREQLRQAIADRADYIVIIDPKLARSVWIVSKASRPALLAALATIAASASMAWNPVGPGLLITGGVVAGPLVSALAFLIVVLGVGLIKVLFDPKIYTGTVGGKVSVPGLVAVEFTYCLKRVG